MYKTLLLSFILTVILTSTIPKESHHHSHYKKWKAEHGITYEETEDRYRVFLFKQADSQIKAHNKNPYNTYKKGHNEFSSLTFEEFEDTYLMKDLQGMKDTEQAESNVQIEDSEDSQSESDSSDPIVKQDNLKEDDD